MNQAYDAMKERFSGLLRRGGQAHPFCSVLRGAALVLGLLVQATQVRADDPPSFVAPLSDVEIFEDDSAVITFDISDEAPASVQVTAVSSDSNLVQNSAGFSILAPTSTSRQITIQPVQNANGSCTITVTLEDNLGQTINKDFQFSVVALNDPPTFILATLPNIYEDFNLRGGDERVLNFLNVTGLGAANESGQTIIDIQATVTDHPEYFSVQPYFNLSGSLFYELADDYFGTAKVLITVTDDGSNSLPGDDNSSELEFDFIILPVNDEPTFTSGGTVTLDEDDPALNPYSQIWATNIGKGADVVGNESSQNLTFHVSNDNPSLFSVEPTIREDGTLEFALEPNENGQANISVYLTDDGGTNTSIGDDNQSVTRTLLIQVLPVPDPPTISGNVLGLDSQSAVPDTDDEFIFSQIIVTDVDNPRRPPDNSSPDEVKVLVTFSGEIPGQFTSQNIQKEDSGFSILASPEKVTSYLQGVVFRPSKDVDPVGLTEYDIQIIATSKPDELSVTNAQPFFVESVNDIPVVRVRQEIQRLSEGAIGNPFDLSLTDPDIEETFTLSILLENSSDTNIVILNPSDANNPGQSTITGTQTQLISFVRNQSIQVAKNSVTGTVTVPFRFLVNDGHLTNPVIYGDNETLDLEIRGINDPPSILNTPSTLIRMNDDEDPKAVLSETRISDADGGGNQLVTLSLRIRPLDSAIQVDLARFGLPQEGGMAEPIVDGQSVSLGGAITGYLDGGMSGTIIKSEGHGLLTGDSVIIHDSLLGYDGVHTVTWIDANQYSISAPFGQTGNGGFWMREFLTPSQATILTQALLFQPVPNQIPVDQTESVEVALKVTDDEGVSRAKTFEVSIRSVNGAPLILGVIDPKSIQPDLPIYPFETITIEDDDDDQYVFVRITLDDLLKGHFVDSTLGSFIAESTGGNAWLAEGDVLTITSQLRAIEFQYDPNYIFPATSPGGTTFTVEAHDRLFNRREIEFSMTLDSDPRNWVVTSAEDTDLPGSFRFALANADNFDVITFALPEYPAVIRLTHGDGTWVVSKHLSIRGPGARYLTLSGDQVNNGKPGVQLFKVRARLDVEGVAFTLGKAVSGGALQVESGGHLILRSCAISKCEANLWGGAIDVNGGKLEVSQCVFENNKVKEGVGLGGGAISIFTNEDCDIFNSTFSLNHQGNQGGFGGAALYIENKSAESVLNIRVEHCTFAENLDQSGHASSLLVNVFGAKALVKNNIFADGQDINLQVRGAGQIVTLGGNLSDDSARTTLTQDGKPLEIQLLKTTAGDLISTDPKLVLPLAPIAGGLKGYRLEATSPAINSGETSEFSVDQMGRLRQGSPDSGALEYQNGGRILVNEIFLDDPDANVADLDFIEFFVPRNSVEYDLSGLEVWVSGLKVHTFASGTRVAPGFGLVLTDDSSLSVTSGNLLVLSDLELPLGDAGSIEVKTTDQALKPVFRVDYNSRWVDLSNPDALLTTDPHSLTLAPEFSGAALLPHGAVKVFPNLGVSSLSNGNLSLVSSLTSSPGADLSGTPFGASNALPIVADDTLFIFEDQIATLDVLANDFDLDGNDFLYLVDLSNAPQEGGNDGTLTTLQDADAEIIPSDSPLRGIQLGYNPRNSVAIQSLASGQRLLDTLYYSVSDYASGVINDFQSVGGNVAVSSLDHRLAEGDRIQIEGSDGGVYDGLFEISILSEDSFLLINPSNSTPVSFSSNPSVKGQWEALSNRVFLNEVSAFEAHGSDSNRSVLHIPAHGLVSGDEIVTYLSSDSGINVTGYQGAFVVSVQDSDRVSIATAFVGNPEFPGLWFKKTGRDEEYRQVGKVTFSISGLNDPPVPNVVFDSQSGWTAVQDLWATEEDAPIRILASPDFLGVPLSYDTDDNYSSTPDLMTSSLLENDMDPDWDDDFNTLNVVRVFGSVQAIVSISGTEGERPVTLEVTNHNLVNGDRILVSGHPGNPSLNGVFSVSVVDESHFTVPVTHESDNGLSSLGKVARLSRGNPLTAVTPLGARVNLEIRADRHETSVVYDPSVSSILNALSVSDPVANDTFYYAVEDRHGGMSLAEVNLTVQGVNDVPEPQADPSGLSLLEGILPKGLSPEEALQQIKDWVLASEAEFMIQGDDSAPGTVGVRILLDHDSNSNTLKKSFVIPGIWMTGEDTVLTIEGEELLGNDFDVDATDVLTLLEADSTSVHGAIVSLDVQNQRLEIDPRTANRIQSLARGELLLDVVGLVVTDGHLLNPTAETFAVIVFQGRNDSPVAVDDFFTVSEDSILVLGEDLLTEVDEDLKTWVPGGVVFNDIELDIDGHIPDDSKIIFAQDTFFTAKGAQVSIGAHSVVYDPTVSDILNRLSGLSTQQDREDSFQYTLMDTSLIFAMDDFFKIQADVSSVTLNVLENDRNYTGNQQTLTIVSVGTPIRGGVASVNSTGTAILYSPQVNFVGDDHFNYTIQDLDGNQTSGLITVRMVVDQLNGNLQANDDYFTLASGVDSVIAVLTNDNMIPDLGEDLILEEIIELPAHGTASIENNAIRYTPDNLYAGSDRLVYRVSGGATASAQAEVNLEIVDRSNTLIVREDYFGVLENSKNNTLDVLENDNILPGSGSGLIITGFVSLNLDGQASPIIRGSLEISADGRGLVYSPNTGFIGKEKIRYFVSDGVGGTGDSVVNIEVGTIATANDIFTVPFNDSGKNDDDGPYSLPVLDNDVKSGDSLGSLHLVSITALPPVGPSLGSFAGLGGGDQTELTFFPAVDQVGEQRYEYLVADAFGRQAKGVVTLVVVESGVVANADYWNVPKDSESVLLNVLANDVVLGGGANPIVITQVGVGDQGPNQGGQVVIDPDGVHLLYTPAKGFTGEERFTYTLSDSVGFDTASVVIQVGAGNLLALPDSFTVYYEEDSTTGIPVEFELPVLNNDGVLPDFGQILTITGVGINDTVSSNAPDQQGQVRLSADGSMLFYRPGMEPASLSFFEETFTYVLSDGTSRRSEANVTVQVRKRTLARDLETNDDAYTVRSDSSGNLLRVLANDDIKPSTAAGWRIVSVTEPTHALSSNPNFEFPSGVLFNSGSALVYTPPPGFIGTETFTYFVSDGLGGTGEAEVTVQVGDIHLGQDTFVAMRQGGETAFRVLVNDLVLPAVGEANADPKDNLFLAAVYGENQTSSTLENGTVQLGSVIVDDQDFQVVLYTPDSTPRNDYPYQDAFTYEVENASGERILTQAVVWVYSSDVAGLTATVNIDVQGENDPPTMNGTIVELDVYQYGLVRPFSAVTLTEIDDGDILCAEVRIENPLTGLLNPSLGFLTTDPVLQTSLDVGANGLYNSSDDVRFCGTESDLEVFLRSLYYAPTSGSRVNPELMEPARIRLTISDSFQASVVGAGDIVSHHPEVAQLEASDGQAGESVGFSSGASLSAVVLGAPLRNGLSSGGGALSHSGAAYVYRRGEGGDVDWGHQEMLVANDAGSNHEFGYSVGIDSSGTRIVVGARGALFNGVSTGAAYVFEPAGGESTDWIQVAKLGPSDGSQSDFFGTSVAISPDGNRIAVGSTENNNSNSRSGSVYVYRRESSGQWVQEQKVIPFNGNNKDVFGISIDLDSNLLLVGSPEDGANPKSGSSYLFRFDSATPSAPWVLVSEFFGTGGNLNDQYGRSVTLYGDWFAVGAPWTTSGGIVKGSVFVYGRDATQASGWAQKKVLTPTDLLAGDEFGFSVSMDEFHLIIGARKQDAPLLDSGSMYVYGREKGGSGNWGMLQKIVPNELIAGSLFGTSVSVGQGTGVVTAVQDSQSLVGEGKGFLYRFKFNNAPAILDGLLVSPVSAVIGQPFAYTLPAGLFADPDWQDSFTLSACLEDGTPVPAPGSSSTETWLRFNPSSGELSGTPDSLLTTEEGESALIVRIKALDEDGVVFEINLEIELLVVPAITFSGLSSGGPQVQWVQNFFASNGLRDGDVQSAVWQGSADPDLDGVKNRDEYAFGTDPQTADGDQSRVEIKRSGDGMAILFQRRMDDLSLRYRLEGSKDLGEWFSISDVPTLEPLSQGIGQPVRRAQYNVNREAMGEARFFRIRVMF